jgi:hypothetical protein
MMPTPPLSHLRLLIGAEVVKGPVVLAIGYVIPTLDAARV